jgi:hypothetical protein
MAGLTPELFDKLNSFHPHAAVNRFAHVVDCQKADVHGRERLHLDTGASDGFSCGCAGNRIGLAINGKINGDAGE